MKRVDFVSGKRRWDTYRAFHILTGKGFVQFETGEVICTRSKFDPDERGRQTDHDVYLVHPDDGLLEFYDEAGERIPTAHLTTNGNPTLMFDPQFGVAVNMGRIDRVEATRRPTHLRAASVTSLSEDAPPVGSGGILLSAPFVATREQKQWLKEAEEYCKVMYEMMREGHSYWVPAGKSQVLGEKSAMPPTDFVDEIAKTGGIQSLAVGARNGLAFARVCRTVSSINARLK